MSQCPGPILLKKYVHQPTELTNNMLIQIYEHLKVCIKCFDATEEYDKELVAIHRDYRERVKALRKHNYA